MTQKAQQKQEQKKPPINAEMVVAFQTTIVAGVAMAFFFVLFILNGMFTVQAMQAIAAQVANPATMPTDAPSRAIVQVAIWILDWKVAWAICVPISFFEAWGWQTSVKMYRRLAYGFMVFDVLTTLYGLYLVGISQGIDYATPLVIVYIILAVGGGILLALAPEYALVETLGYIGLIEVPNREIPGQKVVDAATATQRRVQAQREEAQRQRAMQQQAEAQAQAQRRKAEQRASQQQRKGASYEPDEA